MKNPLTSKIESWLAVSFILGLSIFFGLIIHKAVAEFEAELSVMESQRAELIFER